MDKTDIVNSVVREMPELSKEQQDRLKITFWVKMQNYEITAITHSESVFDNESLLEKYRKDSAAADLKKSTVEQYVMAMRTFFKECGKEYYQVTSQDIVDYLSLKQRRDHISQNYKSTLYRYFCSVFGWAYRNDYIEMDITKKIPKVKMIQKKKEKLTADEIEDIRDACQTLRERALIELMLSTGMRVGEIVLLNRSDIDLLHKRVNIYGEKTSKYRIGMLTPKAVSVLRKYIENRCDTNEALFVGERHPYNRLKSSSIEKVIKELATRAGITRIPVTVHVYRKTFATTMYRKTKDVLLVSKLLGHAKTDMTVQYYLIDDIDDMQYRYDTVNG